MFRLQFCFEKDTGTPVSFLLRKFFIFAQEIMQIYVFYLFKIADNKK